jgi:tetratricopeptide (TPR) repeat protein
MVTSLVGEDVDLTFAATLQQQTEGNPFFIQEIARYLMEEGLIHQLGDLSRGSLSTHVPEGVRDVIGKRLSKLGAECNQVLSVAAIIGREFGLRTLQRVTDLDEEELLAALEQAQRARVLDDASVHGEVRFRFTHALFRQTLYEELFTPRRLRLHQRVARALEAEHSSHLEDHAAELSDHFAQSGDAADLDRARHYAEIAAARATRLSAHGEAVRHLRSALHLLDLIGEENLTKRCDLVMALGEAMLASGDGQIVLDEVAPEAFRLAESLGDRRRAFAAALLASRASSSLRGFAITSTPEFRTWAQRLEQFAQTESVESIIADHAMMASLWAQGQATAAHQLKLRSLRLGRRLAQLQAVSTIVIEPWMTPPFRQRERLALANELRPGIEVAHPAARRCLASLHVGDAYLTWGDRDTSQALWDTLPGQAEESQVPFVRTIAYRARLLADCLDGELQHALELGEAIEGEAEALGLGPFARATAAIYLWRSQLYLGLSDQSVAGLTEALQQVAPSEMRVFGFPGVLSAQLAACLAHAGRIQDAQIIVERFLQARTIGEDGDETPMPILVALLEAAVLLHEATVVKRLVEPLGVAAGLVCVDNTMTVVARHLGTALALLGEVDQAVAYTRQAIEVAEKVRFRPELALARLQLAELLSSRPDDPLIAELESMRMQPVVARARALAE